MFLTPLHHLSSAGRNYPGLSNIVGAQLESGCAVCMHCFNEQSTSLITATVRCGKDLNPSNLRSHLCCFHKNDGVFAEFLEKERMKNEKEKEEKKSKGVAKELARKARMSSNFTMDHFTLPVKEVLEKGERLMYFFFTKANIPHHHCRSPELESFLRHIVQNIHVYGKQQKLSVSRYKMQLQRLKLFTSFVELVRRKVCQAREFYKVQGGNQSRPFLYVSHDGWDSEDFDILGVSVHFVDPTEGKMFRAAIGLQRMIGKTSQEQAAQIKVILAR